MDETEKTQLIEKIVDANIPDEAFYEDQASSFKSAAMIRQQIKNELVEFLESDALQESLLRAVELLLSDESGVFLTDQEQDELEQNLSKITEDKLMNPSDEIRKIAEEQHDIFISYQKIFDLSNDSLLIIYKLGHHYFQNQNIDEAIDIFTLLETLNPLVADFNYALGLCYQQKEQWLDAVTFLTLACNIDPSHVGARISLIECHQQLKNDQEVSKCIDEIKHIQEAEPEKVEPWLEVYESLKDQ